eukprot:6263443-Pyramimonas_sp.AAC.1
MITHNARPGARTSGNVSRTISGFDARGISVMAPAAQGSGIQTPSSSREGAGLILKQAWHSCGL